MHPLSSSANISVMHFLTFLNVPVSASSLWGGCDVSGLEWAQLSPLGSCTGLFLGSYCLTYQNLKNGKHFSRVGCCLSINGAEFHIF
jgi:hypothetical protein